MSTSVQTFQFRDSSGHAVGHREVETISIDAFIERMIARRLALAEVRSFNADSSAPRLPASIRDNR